MVRSILRRTRYLTAFAVVLATLAGAAAIADSFDDDDEEESVPSDSACDDECLPPELNEASNSPENLVRVPICPVVVLAINDQSPKAIDRPSPDVAVSAHRRRPDRSSSRPPRDPADPH